MVGVAAGRACRCARHEHVANLPVSSAPRKVRSLGVRNRSQNLGFPRQCSSRRKPACRCARHEHVTSLPVSNVHPAWLSLDLIRPRKRCASVRVGARRQYGGLAFSARTHVRAASNRSESLTTLAFGHQTGAPLNLGLGTRAARQVRRHAGRAGIVRFGNSWQKCAASDKSAAATNRSSKTRARWTAGAQCPRTR